MRVGFIGLGLMGRKRAHAIAKMKQHEVTAAYDPNPEAAAAIAAQLGPALEASAEDLINRPDLDVIVLAVPHFKTKDLVIEALRAGKHVFCEKPLGRNLAECDAILSVLATCKGTELGVGLNYRFYPGIRRAREIIQEGGIGTVTHLRSVLGHGARPGFQHEWKARGELCGGGALLDPGVHVIDLVEFFLGPIHSGSAILFQSFWDHDVEDNAFLVLDAGPGCKAQVHVSITEWKNRFSFDVFGTDGCISVSGRGGFYGSQSLRHTRRWGWATDPAIEDKVYEYEPADVSLTHELESFLGKLQGVGAPAALAGSADARRALSTIEDLYRNSRSARAENVDAACVFGQLSNVRGAR